MHLAVNVGLNCTFIVTNDFISHPSGLVVDLVRHHGLAWLPVPSLAPALLTTTPSPSRDLIYRRCGHLPLVSIGIDSLGIFGIPIFSKLSPMSVCPDCTTIKSTVANINRRPTRDRDPHHLSHILTLDIWGPTCTPDLYGNRYVLGAICNTAASIVVVLLEFKSDTPVASMDQHPRFHRLTWVQAHSRSNRQ